MDELQQQGLELVELVYFNFGIELAQLLIILSVVALRVIHSKLSFVLEEVERNAQLGYYCCGAFGIFGLTVYLIENLQGWIV